MLISQGHSLSDGLDDVQRAEMKAYMELVNNMLLTAEVHTHDCNSTTCFQYFYINLNLFFSLQLYIQWCDDVTAAEVCLNYLKSKCLCLFSHRY